MAQYIFKQNTRGSKNGYDIITFSKGQSVDEYALGQDLFDSFMRQGVINKVQAKKAVTKKA